jgi:CheY-like chemotaxis protein
MVPMSGEKKLILIIEDDDSVRMLLTRALGMRYQVEVARDGNEAIERLQRRPIPDLLICDIMMPGVDGLTVAKRAKASPHLRQVPIVFLTAKTTPNDVIQGINAGARHYITKPFKLNDLLAKVTSALKQ